VKVCKLRGVKNARVVSITEVNSKLGVFDTILMIGNNFGLFGNPARAKRLLRKLRQLTSRNALIIAESVDPYQYQGTISSRLSQTQSKQGQDGW